MELSDLKCGI